MKKCPKPLGYGIRRTPVVLGLSAALCMPAAFSYANVDNGMDRESVLSVMQGKTIKGQILDETGESMIGVSVLVKGTTIGTVTDFDGNYTLEVPSGKNILEISYIGYKTKEITIGNNSLINIKMEPDTQALDEVVVIGYGTVKKRDLTGAVASMKNEDVTVAPTSNVMEALQGKIAGMDIVKSSGQVGEDVSILLRGSRSIYGSNEPLFIIDGIPGSYSQVNPSDIESVDVLKDASSTAIYGSAGANGVVIITTKRGKEGKATVNFDAYYGFSGSPNYKHGMVGDEWVNLPLGGIKEDWTVAGDARQELVSRLHEVGEMAVKDGVVIGIRTPLDAGGDIKLLKEINSKGIKIYYSFQNALENGRDLCKELKKLGKDRICQIHCTDTDGVTLPYNTRLDMNAVKHTLDKMGWSGWLVIERSRNKDEVRNVKKNFGTNVAYLKQIFQQEK